MCFPPSHREWLHSLPFRSFSTRASPERQESYPSEISEFTARRMLLAAFDTVMRERRTFSTPSRQRLFPLTPLFQLPITHRLPSQILELLGIEQTIFSEVRILAEHVLRCQCCRANAHEHRLCQNFLCSVEAQTLHDATPRLRHGWTWYFL